ncbi:MAG TPA: hypothetical protein EYP34_12395 [Chromatiaceae bacterium]|nr:hypothetical protein [Chromatiaceae bacterium]
MALPVHGYLSDAGTWERSGVNALLRQAGWQYAGNLGFSPTGLIEQPVAGEHGDQLFYTVNLPSLAPAPAQASWLKAATDYISQKNPNEKLTLVGHSAGDSGMFGMVKEWFVRDEIGDGMYHTLKASRGILFNLVPPAPVTLLFWLNAQPHPDIEYVSVIRSGGYVIASDLVVPPFSQDMNMIPALRGKSKRWLSFQGHELTPMDGKLLAEIL